MKLLIADDNRSIRLTLRRLVQKWGYDAIEAEDGRKACELLTGAEPPRIAILDWIMPGMDGVAICRRLLEETSARLIYTILLTSKNGTDDLVFAFENGACDFLSKPVEPNELRSRIAVGRRLVEAEDKLNKYAVHLEELVELRARQLIQLKGEVTRRRKVEQALQEAKKVAEVATQAKSEFLANMSHELRTPLNSVIGFSEVLYDETFGPLNEKQKDYLNDVLESGKHLLALINDILDLAKVESGKMELQPSVFLLKDMLEGSLVLIKEKALKHGIRLETDIADDIGEIEADQRKVKQIIFNLLSNAAKFTPDGGQIGIRAKKIDNEVEVAVWDTGIGIAKEDQEKVFLEFQQVENPYSKKYAGTGLGLSLTGKLVKLHDGKIWVESEGKDKGSTFLFTLPLTTGGSDEC